MRVLITGATGFLGSAAVRAYAQKGWQVVATGRAAGALAALPDQVEKLRADLSREDDLAAFAAVAPVDAVVHTAGLSAPFGPYGDFHRANVMGTRNALTLAKRLRASRFIHISSPSVAFAPKNQVDLSEDLPLPKPVNAYARSKAEAEQLVQAEREIATLCLRPRGIYGAGDVALLPRLLRAATARPLPLLRQGQAAIDLTHVSDVVAAIEAALLQDVSGQVINISGGEMLPVREIVEKACARAQVPLRWRSVPLAPAMAAARAVEILANLRGREPLITPYSLALFAWRQSLDLSKAERLLGWRPHVGFDEGLALTFAGQIR